tara:strand:+ start:649 stop:1212 length:564 start_codon:yes stop_codon:yes gene_type:complete
MELKNFIKIYDSVLNENTFNNLLKVCKTLKYDDATVGDNRLDKQQRNVGICTLCDISDSMTEVHWGNLMQNVFYEFLVKYLKEQKIKTLYGVDKMENAAVLKYNESNFYIWHYDDGPQFPRTFSFIYFLNNDFEGGELFFRNPNGTEEFSIEKNQNRLVIWPSCFLFPHSVKKVTKGTRYSIVSWIQ